MVYSHSRLSTFEQCRLKFKYRYIDRIKTDKTSVEAYLGSCFHDTMELLYKKLEARITPLDDLNKSFIDNWEKKWKDGIFIVKNDMTPEDYKKIGLKALKSYYNRHHPFDEGRLLGVEKKIFVDIGGDPRYKIICIIDRLVEREDGHYEIHDYKTSGYLPEQSYFDNDRQLAIYEFGLRTLWNDIKNVDLIWHYVRFDKEFSSKRTPGQLEEVKENIISLINMVETTSDFPPNESHLCQWCEYIDICPLFSHKTKTEQLEPNEYLSDEGVELVNKYASLETEKKRFKKDIDKIEREQEKIKEAAIVYAEKEKIDRIYGSDKKLTIKDDLKVDYPKGSDKKRTEFIRTLFEMGLWDVITDISWQALKKIARLEKWNQAVPESLKKFIKVNPVKRVVLSKRKDSETDKT